MIDANELTFGVECETAAPTILTRDPAGRLEIGPHHAGIQIPYLPSGWKAEDDGSISTSGYSVPMVKCEITSPVLHGAPGIKNVIDAMIKITQKGHAVNKSCGVHIHIGWKEEWPNSGDEIKRLIGITAYCERGLYAITGTKKREQGSFCHSIRAYGNPDSATRHSGDDRYHILNLTNVTRRNARQRTVEFRCFSGSTSPVKIAGWIQVCLGIVQRAVNCKRVPVWNPKPPTGGWMKDGPGESECERLIGYLAWGEVYARINNGIQYGWIADPNDLSQEKVKEEFRRLAKQYDTGERQPQTVSRPAPDLTGLSARTEMTPEQTIRSAAIQLAQLEAARNNDHRVGSGTIYATTESDIHAQIHIIRRECRRLATIVRNAENMNFDRPISLEVPSFSENEIVVHLSQAIQNLTRSPINNPNQITIPQPAEITRPPAATITRPPDFIRRSPPAIPMHRRRRL
jgi:hypothetical protein